MCLYTTSVCMMTLAIGSNANNYTWMPIKSLNKSRMEESTKVKRCDLSLENMQTNLFDLLVRTR